MPLKKSSGQMYPWVTHTHSHLAGACPHACSYCYVRAMAARFPSMKTRYSGPIRLIEKEFEVDYGEGRTIFVEHMNDLFAKRVPRKFINLIIAHCLEFPRNEYVFQTKNPERYFTTALPSKSTLGCTIETNRSIPVSAAQPPLSRAIDMASVRRGGRRTFITIEPILDFDLDEFRSWLRQIKPNFINIGADSKNRGLPEPPIEKVEELIAALKSAGIEVREKRNLERLRHTA